MTALDERRTVDAEVVQRASRGRLLAAVLTGAWRRSPPPLTLSRAELADVTIDLLPTGAGALGWRRVRGTDLRESGAGGRLQQAYRAYAIRAALSEREVRQAVALLGAAGAEAILVRGWAVARLYPEPGLRPYGAIDLCVRPTQQTAALEALAGVETEWTRVAVRSGVPGLVGRDLDDLYRRSEVVPIEDTAVRVLGREDHLRLLCRDALGRGASQPLAFCDVAVALASLPPSFDWGVCLSGDERRSEWTACAVGLAHRLLGADLSGCPVAEQADRLAERLAARVLARWARC